MKTIHSYLRFPVLITVILSIQGCSSEKNEVLNFWSGAIQSTSIRVNVKLIRPSKNVRLVVSLSNHFIETQIGSPGTADTANKEMLALSINGLLPNHHYYYAIQSDGKLDTSANDIGTFYTPADSACSFKLVLGSCLASGSHHPVISRMLEKEPLFFLQMGDFHYDNPNSPMYTDEHRMPYEKLLANPTYRPLFQHCPIAYVWDDHDYAGNNSDSIAAGKTNARLAYREYIPHYDFGTEVKDNDAPIYQSFTIGRVHFIVTDLRSARREPSMMGTEQKQWFKNECVKARDSKQLIAWVSTVSYGGTSPDNWGGFASERKELADFFRDSIIKNMFILSGDAHMVAIDDGSHHDFSSGHNNPYSYPVLQAAALNQNGSYKGGTYSGGYFPNPNNHYGQYGLVEVTDHGDSSVQIQLTGFRVNENGEEMKLTSYKFARKLQ